MAERTSKIVLGCISFTVFWIMAVFPHVQFLPVGRTAGTLMSAFLMVVFRVLSPDEALAAVNLPILALLFGTMVVGAYLERCDLFHYLRQLLSWRCNGGPQLLARVCLLAGLVSAVLTNDTTCVTLTPFVVDMCHRMGLPPQPFLIGLATSANIGSAATPIGNPQNLIVAISSGIPFLTFTYHLLPPVAVGLVINTVALLVLYWRKLSPSSVSIEELPGGGQVENGQLPDNLAVGGESVENVEVVQLAEVSRGKWREYCFRASVYIVTLGMIACFLAGLDLAWTAVGAAVVMMTIDFTDATPILSKVSYSLLVFFSGMFIAVQGFNSTGLPGDLWDAIEPHSRLDSAKGTSILSIVILFLSNVASNVPTVLLLGPQLADSAAETPGVSVKMAWLLLAWVSTVAGNLTMLGSAANIIVSEQARQAVPHQYNLSFWNHLRFGFPSTIIVTSVGVMILSLY